MYLTCDQAALNFFGYFEKLAEMFRSPVSDPQQIPGTFPRIYGAPGGIDKVLCPRDHILYRSPSSYQRKG